jgi:hypothetical protein
MSFILELVDNLPAAILIKEKSIPSISMPNGSGFLASKQSLKDETIIISDIYDYPDKNYVSITFTSLSGNRFNKYFPKDFAFSLLSGNEGEKVIEQYFDFVASRLSQNLSHNFCITGAVSLFAEDENGKLIPSQSFITKEEFSATDSGYSVSGGNRILANRLKASSPLRIGTCLEYYTDSVSSSIYSMDRLLKSSFPKARLSEKSVFSLSKEEMESFTDYQLNMSPCSNAYGKERDYSDFKNINVRSAYGVISFGISGISKEKAIILVKAIDAICGIAYVSLMDGLHDERHQALPGNYLIDKDWLHYCAIDNKIYCHPLILNLVIDLMRKSLVMGDKKFLRLWKADENDVYEIIASHNVKRAREILLSNKEVFKQILLSCYSWVGSNQLETIFSAFYNGANSILLSPGNFKANWKFGEWKSQSHGNNVKGFIEKLTSNVKV